MTSCLVFAVGAAPVSNQEWSILPDFLILQQEQKPDSTRVEPPVDLQYKISDISGDPTQDQSQQRGLNLNDPSNIDYRALYDYKTGNVTIYRKIGDLDVRLPYTMTLDEYMDMDTRNSVLSYWRERQNDLLPNRSGQQSVLNRVWDNVGGKGFESIFGSNSINIRLQGMAELKIGLQQTKIDNPTLQERLRKTTTFNFEEKIQMNITGNIGDKLKLGVNYNTEATFDFENQIKLEYEGDEDEILKKVEAGNVTLPLPGTLITGSQSLFGVKTEMQFGKLTVTSIFSQQKGETKVMNIEGGAQTQDYEVRADEYDRNRHFFLTHFFRSIYDEAHANMPLINSPFTIEKIEVWVTNRSGNFDESRNILAFMDLAENSDNLSNDMWDTGNKNDPPENDVNSLYHDMSDGQYRAVRDINKVTETFAPLASQDFINGKDYEKIESARKLTPAEYKLNSKLGYISLNSSLNADEVLAVAFEYSYNGKTYRVGEFSNAGIDAPQTLYLKLLKGTNLTPRFKTWDLMMKNIYSIGAYQVNREDFIMDVVYVDDETGTDISHFPEGNTPNQGGIKGELLIKVMNLDTLNSMNEPGSDGIFDFIEDVTIYPENGRIIFPVLEPFGSHLKKKLINQQTLIDKYVFQALYDSTYTIAEQMAEKNKFKLKGRYKSSSSNEISLNAMNVPQGSVIVTAGGLKLVENIDYTVDYTLGRVKIINQGLMESGTPIKVSLENQSLFNLQTKTLLGTHLDYRFNKDFNVGATIMHLSERPLTQKVNVGSEPISNTIWGLNTSYYTESEGLTRLIDKLPLVETKEKSSITFEGEFAQLIPGSSSAINGNAYIDDFEGTQVAYDMKNWTAWKLTGTPQDKEMFPESEAINDLSYGFNRAKLAWYVIDPLFLRNMPNTPKHIKDDEDQRTNHFVREVYEQELFPNKETAYGQPTNIPVLNVAYYPNERGPYNYDATNIDENGFLKEPEKRWGGIMRKIETNDFEAANIEYIEFWMMDPYVYTKPGDNSNEGKLYFNLGNISEDILRDSRKSFEQGLPGPNDPLDVDSTQWGYIPTSQSLVNAFSNDPQTRLKQDVGLDGLSSEQEQDFFRKSPHPYLNLIETLFASNNLTKLAYEKIMADPSSDDYHYFRGSDYDENKVSILDRYKDFNNPEGNSVPSENSPESYPTAATSLPDVEDINLDNTLSENESYFQYEVDLYNGMDVNNNDYIVDRRDTVNSQGVPVKWFQFRIPISNPQKTVGIISDLRSIRFMRMYLHDFADTTILRFATLDLVRGEWRKYQQELVEEGGIASTNAQFDVSAVNIEENGNKQPVNYVLPPGVDRQIDPANPQLRQLNEQAILLKVKDLNGNDAKAVYKTLNMDMRQYGRIKMDVHAEAINGSHLEDQEVTAFMRLGSDYTDNYYEYEIPLNLTDPGRYSDNSMEDRLKVWPEENKFDVPLELFQQVKLRRNDEARKDGTSVSNTTTWPWPDPDKPNNLVKIKGNPNLSNVRTIMIGVRAKGAGQKSVEVWFNELRLTDFDEDGGWAANGRMSVKLADLGNVSVAGKTSTIGFGSIDQSVMERSMEDHHQYDIATNLELGKLLGPESRLSVPFYYGYSKSVSNPKYYPLDPDIPLEVALNNADSEKARDSIKHYSQKVESRKSLNFTNVKITPKQNKKPKFYSPSNISATYSYNETSKRDVNTVYSTDKNYRGVLGYNFNNRPKPIEPFKKIKGKSLKLIRDFNFYLLPTQISYRWEMLRQYRESQLRNNNNPIDTLKVNVSKDFDWNRFFDMRFNLTKSLKLNFKSITNARIDEPQGIVNKSRERDLYNEWREEVMDNIMSFGRTTNYQHNFDVSYAVPINKLPLLDWTTATVQYRGMYNWAIGPNTGTFDTPNYIWGNTIKNSNTIQGNGQLNMTTLYRKVPYLKELDQKYRSNRKQRKGGKRTVRYNKQNVDLEAGKPYEINHKLKTDQVSVRIFDKTGRPVRGVTNTVNANKVEFIPELDSEGARILVTGTIEENNSPFKLALDYTSLLLTSIKNATVSYSENNGTILPGYLPSTSFMGSSNNLSQPGIPFILGWQDREFAQEAANQGWITQDTTFNTPHVMTNTSDFTAKITLEPIKGLRIDLTADRRYSKNTSEYYFGKTKEFSNPIERGNFSMTYNTIGTAFWKVGTKGKMESNAYNKFLNNRIIIADRLGEQRRGIIDPSDENKKPYDPDNTVNPGVNGYSLNSQDVLIPAFLAAYSNTDPNDIFLDAIPSLAEIRPNWRISYDGLSRIKAFKKVIRSFEISHAYRSVYNVGSFMTNSQWGENGMMSDNLSFARDLQDNFVPLYDINSVTITEQFSPLIQFNITWINNFTTRAEIKKSRTLSLSLANNQLIENYNDEFVIGLGYRFDKLNMIFGKGSGQKSISSDLNLRADISIRDNFSIIRRIEEKKNQLTSGQKITAIKIMADYALSERFNMQVFYDTNINSPYISSTYPITNSNFGVSFRFALTQ
ncbi:cell surface protein SprA [Marinilabiliaceae bacterium JC017]|nr:cell surface protein SprA [Marinilabiliaceae bacterium JC017]